MFFITHIDNFFIIAQAQKCVWALLILAPNSYKQISYYITCKKRPALPDALQLCYYSMYFLPAH